LNITVIDSRVDLDDILHLEFADATAPGFQLLLRERTTDKERLIPQTGSVDLRELGLTPGVWDAYGRRLGGSPVRITTLDPGFSLDGLLEYALRPRSMEFRAYRTQNGNLSLRVRALTPHAEVSGIAVGEGSIGVHGMLAYTEPPGAAAVLVVQARRQGIAVEFSATIDGTDFRASVDLDTIAKAHAGGEDYWDCRLEPGRLRLGKHLDDVPPKKTKIRYPAQIREIGGRQLRIWAYYTDHDNFSITVREVEA
jgi:hypothetical protein